MCSRTVSNVHRRDITSGAGGRRTREEARQFLQSKKHRRYISDWSDDEIRLDVSDADADKADVRVVFDGRAEIDVSGGDSVHKTIALRAHPELFATLKALVNEDCHACDEGDVKRESGRTISNFVRLIVWVFRRGRYKLSKVEPKLVKELATELAHGGWWEALGYDARFDKLIERATVDPKLKKSLEGSGHIDKFTCNMTAIRAELRVPISARQIPRSIVERIVIVTGSTRHVQNEVESTSATCHSLYLNLKFLNRCALINGFDSFEERPFKSPMVRARELYQGEHRESRTENLGISDVVTIFTEALRWVYVCSDGVVRVCEAAREELERCDPAILSLEQIGRKVTSRVRSVYKEIAEQFGLPKKLRALARSGEFSLRHLILKLQLSCAIAVLFNHGRRREEVIGKGVPYGLYRGCLTPANDQREGGYLDIYIEKTLQRYASMWANEIVERAVDALERLGQTFRPLNTDPLKVEATLAEARKAKLFVWRHFSYACFAGPPNVFSFKDAAKLFFADLEISVDKVSASHIYRRCFALIYMYRHDHPVLMALSRHLCHVTLETTRVYTTDGRDVDDNRSIESLFAAIDKEDAGFMEEFESVRSEYFREKILQILKGERVGGEFARIVARICRRLESNAYFREASFEEKARQACEAAEKEGYAPEPKANTSCVAGCANRTKRQANCYSEEEGRVRPETASAEMCVTCIHAITTDNHLSTLEDEIEELEEAASDTKRPVHLRLAAKDTADALGTILTRERASAAQMQALMGKLVKGWQPIVFREKSHA